MKRGRQMKETEEEFEKSRKKGLFDKKYVYFMWDDKLEGKDCFTADDMERLIEAVNNGYSRHQVSHTIYNSNLGKEATYDLKMPFRNKDTCTVHQFAYYDPNYECKCAYAKGRPFQYKARDTGKWCYWNYSFSSECSFSDDIEYRIPPKAEEPKAERMTYRELAEWLAKGNGQSKTGYVAVTQIGYDSIDEKDNRELPEEYRIRRWGSDEWIEPTVDVYEADCSEKECNENED